VWGGGEEEEGRDCASPTTWPTPATPALFSTPPIHSDPLPLPRSHPTTSATLSSTLSQTNPNPKSVHLRTHIHTPLGQAMLANVATLARDPSRLLFLLGHLRDNVDRLKREPGLLVALAAARILLATEVNASNYEQV
jgi:hypothetical protein